MEERKVTTFQTISILSIAFLMYASGSLIAPALSALQAEFPDTPFSTIRMIMTSMYLTVAIFSVISGKVTSKISPKTLAVLGLGIYGITGFIGGRMTTVTGLMIVRLVMGCGVGLALAQATGIIVICFKGAEKDKYMGFSTGISNFGSMLGSIIGGMAALVSWRYNFYCFGAALVIMVIVMICVPKIPPVEKKTTGPADSKPISGKIWLIAAGMILIQIFSLVTPTNMAMFYSSEEIGPMSLLGITMALITGIGVVAGFVLPIVRKIFGSFTAMAACLITGAGFLVLWQAHNVGLTMLAQILIGFGIGILLPLGFIANASVSDRSQVAVTNSIMSASLYLGNFLTSYAQKAIQTISGNNSFRFMFLVFGIAALVLAVIVMGVITAVRKTA